MAITVQSPYNGRPVKVREQDMGRAVRDDEGRVFYVLAKSDGTGYYGSKTRIGQQDEPARDASMRAGPQPATVTGQVDETAVHDATGNRGRSWRCMMVIVILAIIVVVLIYLFSSHGPFGGKKTARGVAPRPHPNRVALAQPDGACNPGIGWLGLVCDHPSVLANRRSPDHWLIQTERWT